MRIHRLDPQINDAIAALDQRLIEAKRQFPKGSIEEQTALAWRLLSPVELDFIKTEIGHCIDDRAFYLQNYHVIQPEEGVLTCMAPLYDLQWIVEDNLQKRIAEDGQAFIVILKPRQSGISEYTNGVMCWRTFFLPHAYTLTVAQDPEVAGWMQRKVNVAYDHLPWWMRPERQYHNRGEYLEFNRKDQIERTMDPGLGSIFVTTHAQRGSGIAIGRTIRSLHMTEVSRWPDGDKFTSDIKPTLHAPDTIAIAESTAYGSNGFFYNLWRSVNEGGEDEDDTLWTPVFLPAYRDKKNRIKLRPKQIPYQLTEVEQGLKDRVQQEEGFTIPDEFFKFRRLGIKESIGESGFPYGHLECYPVTPREAFQASGHTAFVRHKLDEQESNIRKPYWVGEIAYKGMRAAPQLFLNQMVEMDVAGKVLRYIPNMEQPRKREWENRLFLWEQPRPNAAYYIAADVGEGIGQDFSVAEIMRAGFDREPDEQVGEWVGFAPPEEFARTLYALGMWFNQCEIAVEYNGPGRATGDYLLTQIEYPNLYRPRQTDRIRGNIKPYFHWETTGKTKPLLKSRMNETLLENGIIIRSEYVLGELRGCAAVGESFEAADSDSHDDAAMAMTICLYCLRQTMPELRVPAGVGDTSDAQNHTPERGARASAGACVYGIYDEFFRLRAQTQDLSKAQKVVEEHPRWGVKKIPISKANTAWSPIYNGRGIENELYRQEGMDPTQITPGLVTQYAAATGRLVQNGIIPIQRPGSEGVVLPNPQLGANPPADGEFWGDLGGSSEL